MQSLNLLRGLKTEADIMFVKMVLSVVVFLHRWCTTFLPWWGWSCLKGRWRFMNRAPPIQQRHIVVILCWMEQTSQSSTIAGITSTMWSPPSSCWLSLPWSTNGMISFSWMSQHFLCLISCFQLPAAIWIFKTSSKLQKLPPFLFSVTFILLQIKSSATFMKSLRIIALARFDSCLCYHFLTRLHFSAAALPPSPTFRPGSFLSSSTS